MFVQTPVLGNDALDIPLAPVRGHRRHPAHLTKCPLAATPINSSTEQYHPSHRVTCVSHVRNAGTASVAERGSVKGGVLPRRLGRTTKSVK